MGWAGFDRFRLSATVVEGGRGIVGAGVTASKTWGVCSHADTGGCSNRAPRSAGEPLTLFLKIIIFVLLPLIFSWNRCVKLVIWKDLFSWGIIRMWWHRGAVGILEAGVMWHWWPWRIWNWMWRWPCRTCNWWRVWNRMGICNHGLGCFSIFRLFVTEAEGGRVSVGAGGTSIEMGWESSERKILFKSTSMFAFCLGWLVTFFRQLVSGFVCLNFS